MLLSATVACSSPTLGPTPLPTPAAATPPVIRELTVVRAGYVEVEEEVRISVDVEDAEVSPSTLRYEWSANVGTFEGAGPAVTWKAAKGLGLTPVEVVVKVTVVDPYLVIENNELVPKEYRVTSEAPVFRLHDSQAEIAEMTTRFLVNYFGDSSVDADQCVSEFTDTCRGKDAERGQIEQNRDTVVITSARAVVRNVTIHPGRVNANVLASCEWRDRDLETGLRTTARGECSLTTVYEGGRWWLCDSHFTNTGSFEIQAVRSRGIQGESSTIAEALRRFGR